MKATVVSFLRGAGWLAGGWRLFRVAPLAWLMFVFLYWLLMTVLGAVPLAGMVVAVALIPAFSVGFMAASRRCALGEPPGMTDLFAGFREAIPAQLALGAGYAALLATLLWATTLIDGGALARWMLSGARPDERTLMSDEFFAALCLAAAGYMPVMMLYWFAPVLATWHGMGAAKALFFSFVACLVNWRAFTGYGAAAALVTLVIPLLILTVMLVATAGQLRASVMGLMLPLLLALMPMLYASFYVSYRDVFGTPAAPPEVSPPAQ